MRLAPVVRIAVVVALLCSVGCSSNNKGKIEGTRWSSLPGMVKGRSIPAGTLKLDFTKDGRLSYDTPGGVFTGTYSLGMGDTVTLHLDRELGGSKRHAQKVVINGNRMTMSDSDGTSLDFERTDNQTPPPK